MSMEEFNYVATPNTSTDALDSFLTASSNFSSISQCPDLKQRIKLKKDALNFVDYIKESQHDPKYKTELCKSWSETGFCAYGNKCRFAHGKHELFDRVISCKKYKQKECLSFFKNKYCSYGSRCHFKHEERKINEIPRSYYIYLLQTLKTGSESEIWNMTEEELVDYVKQRNPGLERKILQNGGQRAKFGQKENFGHRWANNSFTSCNYSRLTFNYNNMLPLF